MVMVLFSFSVNGGKGLLIKSSQDLQDLEGESCSISCRVETVIICVQIKKNASVSFRHPGQIPFSIPTLAEPVYLRERI